MATRRPVQRKKTASKRPKAAPSPAPQKAEINPRALVILTGLSGSGINSFGFKNGVPAEADLVFDVRFLPNPHFIPEFRKLTGKHPRVAKFVRSFPQTQEFLDKVTEMLTFLLPHYISIRSWTLARCAAWASTCVPPRGQCEGLASKFFSYATRTAHRRTSWLTPLCLPKSLRGPRRSW